MKIRLGLLDKDVEFSRKLTMFFAMHKENSDNTVEVHGFSNQELYEEFCESHRRVDVLLADPEIVSEDFSVPKHTVLAYLSHSQDVETIRDVRAVCKYQKASLLRKEIMNLFSELDTSESFRHGNVAGNLLVFLGAAGGVGTTTAAIACAKQLCASGRRVFFLNLEQNGVISPSLSGEGAQTLSEALYAVRSKSSNLSLKLESLLRRDTSDVRYLAPFREVLDAYELTKKDIDSLLEAIFAVGNYDHIVVDIGTSLDEDRRDLLQSSFLNLLVTDGSMIANEKAARIIRSLELYENQQDECILAKTALIYNRCLPEAKDVNSEIPIQSLGKVLERKDGEIDKTEYLVSTGIFRQLMRMG